MAQPNDPYATPSRPDGTPPQQDPAVLPVGGGYRLLRPLGRGAFGEVWKAEAPGGVEVAVKIITRDVKPAEAQRELDALQLMKRLRHHNLLALQAFFPLPDRLIIILELADGSLRGRFEACQAAGLPGIPPAELLRYFREAAEALDYLHERNVQHRDVKPDNLLLLGSHVKVADFGLAKLLEQSQLQTASHAGTPVCMAPEVWNSKLSPHSDQYSLAVSYVQLRTGRFPFTGGTLMALMKAHLMDPPDLASLGPHEQNALRRGLAKKPEDRYPSCTDFVKALVAALVAERENLEMATAVRVRKRPASPPPSSQDTQSPSSQRTVTPAPAPLPASATQPVRGAGFLAGRPWLVPLLAIGWLVLLAGLLLAFLIATRPQDTHVAGAPGRADGPGTPVPQPQPKQQPAAAGNLPKQPQAPADKAVAPEAPPAAKEGEPKAVLPAVLVRAITNSIGMRLALIPAGTFTMGSPLDEAGRRANEGPQHEVEITKPFYLGVYEVTQAQYRAVTGNNFSFFSPTGRGKAKIGIQDTDSFPVESVSWEDAVRFCERLSAQPEETQAGRLYRLPTEAEWEYACRGGAPLPYPVFHFGNSLSSRQANFNGNEPYGGARKHDYLQRTAKVGSYEPNGFGLFDMHGNVWEWCADWYDADYYKASPRQDPLGPQIGTRRVLRGGSWSNGGKECRAAYRYWLGPGGRIQDFGFRVACSVLSRTP
jgi:formylglycine-generating enzyme required for sulfatase activity/serine/threonine protein kinase